MNKLKSFVKNRFAALAAYAALFAVTLLCARWQGHACSLPDTGKYFLYENTQATVALFVLALIPLNFLNIGHKLLHRTGLWGVFALTAAAGIVVQLCFGGRNPYWNRMLCLIVLTAALLAVGPIDTASHRWLLPASLLSLASAASGLLFFGGLGFVLWISIPTVAAVLASALTQKQLSKKLLVQLTVYLLLSNLLPLIAKVFLEPAGAALSVSVWQGTSVLPQQQAYIAPGAAVAAVLLALLQPLYGILLLVFTRKCEPECRCRVLLFVLENTAFTLLSVFTYFNVIPATLAVPGARMSFFLPVITALLVNSILYSHGPALFRPAGYGGEAAENEGKTP